MKTATQDISCALGTSTGGNYLTDTVKQGIMTAAQGGEHTAAYFNNQFTVGNFINWLNSEGDSAWVMENDKDGNPVIWAAQLGAAPTNNKAGRQQPKNLKGLKLEQVLATPNAISMVLRPIENKNVISGKDQPSQFNWNGKNYNVVGSITGTLSYDQQPLWYVDVPVGVIELVPMSALAKIAWPAFVKPLLQGFWRGVKSCFSGAPKAADLADIAGDAEESGEAAAVDSEAVAEDATVSMGAGAAAFSCMLVLAAIPFIIEILSHPSYHTFKVYNLTDYDVNWTPPTIDEGAMNAAPVKSRDSSDFNTVIPAQSWFSPDPDIIPPVLVVHEADFSFASASEFHGLEYAMKFTLTNPKNKDAVVATSAVVFEVPLNTPNQLNVTFSPPSDLSDLFDQPRYQKTQMQVQNSGVTLTITFDYLTGQHPTPSGQNAYTYNSLVVFS
ncbi:hypothetical protein [Dictyobacter formicarum]|uniref:Uncharacterized protein n=1 Tax=Dictyobacter formicarum TaxID=2778368 RepID=A0ABQ3VHV5_9CHLR|nr:hypothetical protein [Dictyobacter formicarum]GHO85757.1 hypothetical protein KSZ_37630 [Dictyobacter formicarum]